MNEKTLVRKVFFKSLSQNKRRGTERCKALRLLCLDRIEKVNEKIFNVEYVRPANKIAGLAQ